PSAASPSATATPVASGNHPQPDRGTEPPATPTDKATCVPGGADHCRPWRPRPALWYSASKTEPSMSAPASARASRSALVEPVSATTSSRRHGMPGPTSPSRKVATSKGDLSESDSTTRDPPAPGPLGTIKATDEEDYRRAAMRNRSAISGTRRALRVRGEDRNLRNR